MNKTNIKVSACIITYNQAAYIRDCLEKAVNQQISFGYEIVVSDDCSTDGTSEICREYAEKNPILIRYHRREQNLGVQKNWIKTLSECRGEYIAICEGDDYWSDPFKLQKQVNFLEANPEYSIIHTNYQRCSLDREITPSKIEPISEYDIEYLIQFNCIRTVTVLIKNHADNLIGFKDKLPYSDWPFFLNCAKTGKIKYLEDITSVYRTNVGVTTTDSFRKPIQNRIDVINWFIKHNPKYRKAGAYSKAIQYQVLIEKGKGDLLKNYFLFVRSFLTSLFFSEKYFKVSLLHTTFIFARKMVKKLLFKKWSQT